MIKVFYFYCNINKYYSSTPIINNIKTLFNNKNSFLDSKIEVTPFIKYIPDMKSMLININKPEMTNYLETAMKNILEELPTIYKKYEKIIFLGFHPIPFQPMQTHYDELKKYPNVFTILWQDDLQAYFKTEHRRNKLSYADHIITPSPIYFKNIAQEYLDKSSFFFYNVDFRFIKGYSQKFSRRINKIILTGCVNPQYIIRQKIYDEMQTNDKFEKITAFLKKPKRKEYNYHEESDQLPFGKNYYKILGSYKGAFFAYYEYPMNFNLAKIIEILSLGCIGFFEESPLLKEELGLEPFVHYVPCTKDGKLITKTKYYKYFLNNEDNLGRKIAEQGRKYIEDNFSTKNGIANYKKLFLNTFPSHTFTEESPEQFTNTLPEAITDTLPETLLETLSETNLESQTDTLPETLLETLSETNLESQTDTLPETLLETLSETNLEPQTDTFPETILETNLEPILENNPDTLQENNLEINSENAIEKKLEEDSQSKSIPELEEILEKLNIEEQNFLKENELNNPELSEKSSVKSEKPDEEISEKSDEKISEKSDEEISEKSDEELTEESDEELTEESDEELSEKSEKSDKELTEESDEELSEESEKSDEELTEESEGSNEKLSEKSEESEVELSNSENNEEFLFFNDKYINKEESEDSSSEFSSNEK